MSSTWNLKEKSTGELVVTVEGDTWKVAQKKAFKKLAKKVNLPGFRPGQVPEKLVRKHISEQNIMVEAVDLIANDVFQEGIKEHDLWVISRPELDVESMDEEKVALKFLVTVKPEVKLGDYKGLDIKKDEVVITDADIEEEIMHLQERYADLVVKEEGKVENGDTAVIDFEGFKDGVPFEGGKDEGYPLVIGSGTFIPGFEEQVLGMGIEETKDIHVTFPEEYHADDLAGQPVVFKVTVHEIKYEVLPDADDELVKLEEIKDVETLDAYKEYSRKNLEESKEQQAEQKFENDILTAITENAKVEIPQVMVDDETDKMLQEFKQRLHSQGLDFQQFAQLTGEGEDIIRKEMEEDATQKVKARLVLEAIAAEEKLEANEEEINKELENIANIYNMPIEQVKRLISDDAISYDVRIRKALELVKASVGE